MQPLETFLKQTIDRFEFIKNNLYDVKDIRINIRADKTDSIVSETSEMELARVCSKDVGFHYIEDISEELVRLLKTPYYFRWLKEKGKEFPSFRIYLYNTIMPFEILVDADKGIFRFECWSKCYTYP